jgi:hypothetical protein
MAALYGRSRRYRAGVGPVKEDGAERSLSTCGNEEENSTTWYLSD